MKYIFQGFFLFVLSSSVAFSQIDILHKVEEKVAKEIEKELNKDDKEKKEEVTEKQDQKDEQEVKTVQQEKKAGLKTFSKYDFIAGEKTVFFDDFSQDNIGDFPIKWNTNSGGEVVEIEGLGKWFMPNWAGTYYPEIAGPLPENFTLEFDLLYVLGDNGGGPPIVVDLISTQPDEGMDALVPGTGGAEVSFEWRRVHVFNWKDKNYGDIASYRDTDVLEKKNGTPIRISMMVQKQRLRVWLEESKIVDVARIMPAGMPIDRIRFFELNSEDPTAKFYIRNFRLAAGVPDLRSKLITEGKLVTHGIYFDSGSDIIKPESYGTLKEIAKVLSENAGVRVNIVGHTDSDGSDVSNLDLSKKRSLSVKNALVSEFGIDGARLEADGKGESQPIDVNTSAEGKANNRRVEFIKL